MTDGRAFIKDESTDAKGLLGNPGEKGGSEMAAAVRAGHGARPQAGATELAPATGRVFLAGANASLCPASWACGL